MPITPPLPPPPPPPPPKKGSSMLGSLVSSKKRILNGRNNSSAPDTQPTNSSAILDQGSTSNGRDLKPYWNGQVAEWSQKLWLPIVTNSAALPSTSSSIYSPSILQNSWFSSTMRPPMNTNFPKISLQSTQSLSAECKEEEPLFTDENARIGKKRKTKIKTTSARNKRQHLETTLNRTLLIKVYPNHPQKQLLKRWMGLTRYAYNAVVRWSQYRRFYTKNSHIGPSQRVWIKPQPIKDKLKLYADVHVGKDVNELEDKKLQKSCVWGERKFIRTVVRSGMLLQGT